MAESINRTINRCFMRFEDRAERIDSRQIAETFVSVGPLLDVLESRNNQIMYGRRGTGKTHALKYFATHRKKAGDLAIYVDCANIGSNQSIYDNKDDLPVSERATRLLVDVCSAMHWDFLDAFSDPSSEWSLSDSAPLLDAFADAMSEVRISGSLETETDQKSAWTKKSGLSAGLTVAASPKLDIKIEDTNEQSQNFETKEKREGTEQTWIDFNFFAHRIRELANFVSPRRIWLLIDEWSTVPPDIQPYLADLIRRSMLNVPNITVKIAAIEHRSTFKLDQQDEQYIGFELGADVSPAINLDDYLVFDNDEERAKHFFRTLIANHLNVIAKEIHHDFANRTAYQLLNTSFTQDNVYVDFVRATEGVPRDAMHILANAAQRATDAPISMPILRHAAYTFFQTDKYSAIQSNPENSRLLDWIRDEVIGTRKTRAFMLPVGTTDKIIDRLFDRRALHILSRTMSAAHRPGERFIVYKLDYGCYVDLINTDKYPEGLLLTDSSQLFVDFDVPVDDGRSYRRAILDLEQFYALNQTISH